MAYSGETIYAYDSYVYDAFTGDITRGSTLTAHQRFSFSGNGTGEHYPYQSKYIVVKFTNKYPKRRLWYFDETFAYAFIRSFENDATRDGENIANLGGRSVISSPASTFFNTGELKPARTFSTVYDAEDYGYDPGSAPFIGYFEKGAPPEAKAAYKINQYTGNRFGLFPTLLSEPKGYTSDPRDTGEPRKMLKFYDTFAITTSITKKDAVNKLKPTGQYEVFNSVTIDSHTGVNPPYMHVFYEEVKPFVSSASPMNGFIDEHLSNKFTWQMGYDPFLVEAKLQLNLSIFQWRVQNSATINTHYVYGTESEISFPPGTFPNGAIQWRVQVYTDDNVASDFTDWYTVSTIDEVHYAPTFLKPSGSAIDGGKIVDFTWVCNSPYGTPQKAFELQVTYDLGDTWQSISGIYTTNITGFSMSPRSLKSGRVGWRVRTFNSDWVSSPWSAVAYITNQMSPTLPQWISIESGKSMPICAWIAEEQMEYELEVLQDSKVIYSFRDFGTAKKHKISEYLEDGQYLFRIRVRNYVKLWSDWSNYNVTIATRKRLKITLSGESIDNGAFLTWETESTQ